MSAQPPPPPPPMQPAPGPYPQAGAAPKPGPGRKWYLVAFLVFFVIAVPALLGFLNGLDGITEGLTRVTVPGETSVELDAGQWTVFYEHTGEFEGRSFVTSADAPGMTMSVIGAGGEQVPVRSSTSSLEYAVGGRVGYAVGEFDIDEPGTYSVEVFLSEQDDAEQYVLALGKDVERSTILLVVGVIGMIAGAGLAFLIWLIVILLRSSAKRKMRAAGYSV